MDIHRCRFVPYQPSAINAVAFSHPNARSAKQGALSRLAVGRANGDIEIWNPSNGAWHQEIIIRGGKDRSIDGLVWVNEPDQDLGEGRMLVGKSRLFSIGYTSTVTEWDIEKGKPKRHASGQHGDIWCLAAQPSGQADAADSNRLVAGTIDGELAMYSIEDDGLRFERILVKSPTKKTQMVSIAFQSRKIVIVGCSDSTIRAYDLGRGQLLRRMTLGADLVGGAKDIIVWSVKSLPNGNIVSGDSTGQVCIWDGKTYTQSQRIQSHKQDVLSLAISSDGTAIISGGMDRRTILHKQNPGAGQRWSKVWGRRFHDHDVKSMATFEHGRISVLVSGGPDTNLSVVPLKEMGREAHYTLSSLPQQPTVTTATKARFIVSWWERQVHIWILRKSASDIFNNASEEDDLRENRKLLKTIVIKGESNIASATINQDGTLLVVSTPTDVKAFHLDHHDPAAPVDVKLSTVPLPPKLTSLGASQVQLSPDGKWLFVVQEGSRALITKVEIPQESETPLPLITHTHKLARLRRSIPRYLSAGGLGAYDRTITHVAFTADSKMVASADLAGYIDTWILRDDKATPNGPGADEADDASSSSESDSSDDESEAGSGAGERWVRNPSAGLLPKLPAAPVVLSFSDDVPGTHDSSLEVAGATVGVSDYTLLTITSSWTLLTWHPLQGSLTPWARRHPRKSLPAPLQDLLALAKGALWQGSRIWVYGVSFLFMLDLSQDFVAIENDATGDLAKLGGKRKRDGPSSGAGSKLTIGNLAPQEIHKHSTGEGEDVDMDEAPGGDEGYSDEDMDDDDAAGELQQLRKAGNGGELVETGSGRKKWWITHKYRPIYGIVPLGAEVDGLEVALVERPLWDAQMPERYFGRDEWDR